jgi:hypothetical protein
VLISQTLEVLTLGELDRSIRSLPLAVLYNSRFCKNRCPPKVTLLERNPVASRFLLLGKESTECIAQIALRL